MKSNRRNHAILGGAPCVALLALLATAPVGCGGDDEGEGEPAETTGGAGGAGTTGTMGSGGSVTTGGGTGGAGGVVTPCDPDEDPDGCGGMGGSGGMGGGAGGGGGGVVCSEPPSVPSSHAFGDTQDQEGYDVAVDRCGNTVVLGRFKGTIDFGGGALTSAGDFDVFLAKFDPTGAYLWSKRFGNEFEQSGRTVAVDSAGNLVLAGDFKGSINFGGQTLNAAGNNTNSDVFVAKLDPNGNHIWSQRFGDPNQQIAYGVAIDSADNVIVSGTMAGSLSFGSTTLVASSGYDALLLKLDPTGVPIWGARFGGGGDQNAYTVATDDQGRMFLFGHFTGGVNFGGGQRVSAGWPDQALPDVFFAVFGENGSYECDFRAGSSATQYGWGITVGPDGNAVVTGQFGGSITFGANTLATGSSTDAADIFLAKVGPDCSTHWAQRFGNGAPQGGRGVSIDGSGSIWMAGLFQGNVNFGGNTLTSNGDFDVFVAEFNPSGVHLFSDRAGDGAEQIGMAIAAGPGAYASVTGHCKGNMNFPGQPVLSCGNARNVFASRIH